MVPLPSTHSDSALQTLATNDPQQWIPVRLWLDFIKPFLTFTPEWSRVASASGGARKHLRDLPGSIKTEFESAERDIEDAAKKADPAKLELLRSRLLQKMGDYKPKIRDAYSFLSGYVFQNNTLSDGVLGNQQWFPSYACLLGNCQNLRSSSFSSSTLPLYDELESVLEFLEKLHLRRIMFRDRELFLDLCIQHGGVAICLAGLLFSCWAEEAENAASAKAKLSDLLLKIKPTSPRLMAQYLEAIRSQIQSLQEELVEELVGITLLAPNGSLTPKPSPDAGSLVFLIKHVVDSPDDRHGELIGRIVSDAAAASDPDSLGLLLRDADLLRTKILLTELGDREPIRQRPRFDDAYSENMMQVLEEIETLMMMGSGGGVDRYVKVSLDFYIAVFQAFLMELLSRSSILMVAVKVQVQMLSKEAKRFRKYSSILPLKDAAEMEMISTLMGEATREAETLHGFFQSNDVVEQNMSDLTRLLSKFLGQLGILNEKMEEVYVQFKESSMVSFPATFPGLSFVESFLERLSGMADRAFPDGYCIKSQIEAVFNVENSLAEVLKKVGEKQNENEELMDLKRRVIRAAYEADYIIDSILLLDAHKCHLLWLSDVVNEMNLVKSDLKKFCGKRKHLVQVQGAVKSLDRDEPAQSHDTPEVGEYIVPLDVQVGKITDLLTKGKSDKFIVGIVGTPGIGKTTLARMVYDHPPVRDHFKKHAWCAISQDFRMRDVFVKILRDMDAESVANLQESDDEEALRQKLFNHLRGKTYLIVMDDLWSDEAWKRLDTAMQKPLAGGTRILFTSRIETVLSSYKNNVVVHSSKPLTGEESWNLLQRRVFGTSQQCPEGLLKVGEAIAISCKGLPLAVVTVSGILRNEEPEPHVWDKIKQHLSSSIRNSASQCDLILKLSYKHLPDYLKPCFLYFAAFHEDQEIQVNRLIRLWISEGLIRQAHPEPELEEPPNDANKVDDDDDDEGCFVSAVEDEDEDEDEAEVEVKALEDVALEYVEDLTSRSLIMAARRGSSNKVKVCKIHDLLHSLCIDKAKEDNFFESITNYASLYPPKTQDYGLDLEPTNAAPGYLNKHRLGIFSKRNQFVKLKPSGLPVRTLLFSAASDTGPTCPYDVSFIPQKFKILKVLDIDSINMDSHFPEKILDLDPLRYLAVRGDRVKIPPEIQRLWNLEDFTVRGMIAKVALPSTIWSLSKLRHLHVYPGLTFDFGDQNSGKLHNLMTLSSPALSQWTDLEAIMEKAPQLQKLKCTFSPDLYTQDSIEFAYPDDLLKLESLKVLYTGNFSEPWELSFPSKLKKLSLQAFRLTFNCISSIGRLRRLQALTLVSISFDDPKWEMGEDEFRKLTVLKMDSLELQEWVVPSSNFQRLERLVLLNCEDLRQVPSAFANIATLQKIELMRCSAGAKASLADIEREREMEFGKDGFTTRVK